MPDDDAFEIDLRTGAAPPSSTEPKDRAPADRAGARGGGRRFSAGRLIGGRYRVVALLGRGGMGEVYKAEDLRLGEDVALKFLAPAVADNPARRARFLAEAKVARKLTHANLCRVHDFVEADGECFISMEYVDGEDLSSVLKRQGRIEPDRALDVAQQLCLGLAAAHERGVLHRDLKPANVMLDARGRVRLMDFGLAALQNEIDADDAYAGTPRYMAPEQLRGGELTAKTDIYALGLVLHEMFTGRLPSLEFLSQTGSAPPATGIDPDVLRVIAACLDPDPRRRPASAIAVAVMLPGGDPLAAAVRAGELPSPAMVAAAVSPVAVSKPRVFALAGAALAGLALVATWTMTTNPFTAPRDWPRPPEALVDRAKEVVRALGYQASPFHEAAGIAVDDAYLAHLRRTRSGADRWRPLWAPSPAGAAVWWRGGSRSFATFEGSYAATPDHPSASDDEVSARISLAGHLVAFEARAAAARPAPPPDPGALDRAWTDLFVRAGLDRSRFREVEPPLGPPVPGDARRAWEGPAPDGAAPARVEGAASGGSVVRFAVSRPWHAPGAGEGDSPDVLATVENVVQAAAFAGFLIFAARNVRRRRGDVRAATRLGAFLAICGTVYWLFQTNDVAGPSGFFASLMLGAGQALFGGLFGGAMYLAVEPFVRRRLPHLLVGSTRVLGGRVTDPLVGRDLLAGAAGAFAVEVLIGAVVALSALGVDVFAPPRRIHDVLGLYGLGNGIAELFRCVRLGPTMAILIAGVFAALFAVLRRRGPAIALAVLLGGVLFAKHWVFESLVLQIVFGILTAAVGFFVLARCGVLAASVFGVLSYANASIPVTFDPNAWYARSAIAYVAAFAVLLVWGWRAATVVHGGSQTSTSGWSRQPSP